MEVTTKAEINAQPDFDQAENSGIKTHTDGVNFYSELSFTNKLSAQNFLAIDIISDRVRYISGTHSGKNVHVKEHGDYSLSDSETEQNKDLKIVLDNVKTNVYKASNKIYVSFFSPDVILKQYHLPKLKKESEFESAIYYKLQSDIISFNEKSVWKYKIIDEYLDGKSELVIISVVIVPGDIINYYLEVLESCGLTPETLIPRSYSALNGYKMLVKDKQNDVVVDIAYDITQVNYISDGQLEYSRNINTGAANLEVAVHELSDRVLGPDTFQLKEEEGIGKNGALIPEKIRVALEKRIKSLNTHQNPVLQLFKNELQNSFEYFKNLHDEKPINRLFLTGYGLQKESLLYFLKNNMKLPVFILSPRLTEDKDMLLKYGQYFSTIGTITESKDSFNLVPKSFKADQLYKKLNWLVAAILVLAVLTMGYMGYSASAHIGELKEDLAEVTRYYEEINPIEVQYNQINKEINKIKQERANLLKIKGESAPVLGLMRLLSLETPEQIIISGIEMMNTEFNPNKRGVKRRGRAAKRAKSKSKAAANRYSVVLNGSVNGDYLMSDVILINYVDHLKNLGYFSNIIVDDKRKRNEKQNMQFVIKAQIQ